MGEIRKAKDLTAPKHNYLPGAEHYTEAVSCASTQEFPSILWNQKAHYRARESSPLVPTLSQTNPVHTTPSYLKSILMLSTHLRLCLPSLFTSGFTTNNIYIFLFIAFLQSTQDT
jgi:hypothetical protein